MFVLLWVKLIIINVTLGKYFSYITYRYTDIVTGQLKNLTCSWAFIPWTTGIILVCWSYPDRGLISEDVFNLLTITDTWTPAHGLPTVYLQPATIRYKLRPACCQLCYGGLKVCCYCDKAKKNVFPVTFHWPVCFRDKMLGSVGHKDLLIFMPPAWKVRRGHLVIELFVRLSVCLSVISSHIQTKFNN